MDDMPTTTLLDEATDCLRPEDVNQRRIDEISDRLVSSSTADPTYPIAVAYLRRACRTSGILPRSCRVPKKVTDVSAEPISQSNFSDIWRGTLDGREVAIKALRLHESERGRVKQAYLHEIVVWQHLRHPNIVPFIGTSQNFPVSLVSDWMVGGIVTKFLMDHPHHDRVALATDVERGLSFMHSLDVVHGDLKAANVLVDEDGRARITDFGLAVFLNSTLTATSSSFAGSTLWMAPELLYPEKYILELGEVNLGQPTRKSDAYALAITVWEIFSGELPFSKYSPFKLLTNIINGDRPPRRRPEFDLRGLNDVWWKKIQGWWDPSPSARRPVLENSANTDVLLEAEKAYSGTITSSSAAFHHSTKHLPITRNLDPLSQVELDSPQPIFMCKFNGCNTHHWVSKDILVQHLAHAHGYNYQRGVQATCLWAGCICSGRAVRVYRCPGGFHPSHVEDLAEHIWDRHLHFRWVCPRCDRADWKDRASLVRHMQKPCPGRMSVRCGLCYQAFQTELELSNHHSQCPVSG